MAKLNLKLVKSEFINEHKLESGYTTHDIQCPLCKSIYKVRDFIKHVNEVHSHKKDMCMAQLLGRAMPVKCSVCGDEVHFDDYTSTFPDRCIKCKGAVNPDGLPSLKGKSSKEMREIAKRIKEEAAAKAAAILEEAVNQEKLEEFSRINFKSLRPKMSNEVKLFVRKFIYELRPLIASFDKQKIFELLNYVDGYVNSEMWKDKEVSNDKSTD